MKDDPFSSNKIIDDSISFARMHCKEFTVQARKNKGQFFTPKKVATFMADLFEIRNEKLRILDPGAGTGILLSAICDRIFEHEDIFYNIHIDAYENDESLIPFLKNTLEISNTKLSKKGHKLSFKIFNSNFILEDELSINSSQPRITKKPKYDLVISNPPYYKIDINSPESRKLKDFVFGQPNIYSFFMISAMQLLKDDGQFIFIIPRSFCSGLYYGKIRDWFVKNTQIEFIHCFESRLKIFEDNVTQETIIFKGDKTKHDKKQSVKISISEDKSFTNSFSFMAKNKIVFERKSTESFIRIPYCENDLKIIQEIDTWENSLRSLEMEISTGKVVDFRTKENLIYNFEGRNAVPLLWMHNLNDGSIDWPSNKYSKPQGILLNEQTKHQVIPVNNYILLKRFTSKNQKRRLYATPLLKSNFPEFSSIGLENHLNYIHGMKEPISIFDLFGVTALFNTSFYDVYYRAFSGNTQVNANEMRNISLPISDKITAIGKLVKNKKFKSNKDRDIQIGKILNFNDALLEIIQNY
jgi:adenine-specific DNA-methyltransferase